MRHARIIQYPHGPEVPSGYLIEERYGAGLKIRIPDQFCFVLAVKFLF